MRALLCHNPTAGAKGTDKDALLAAAKLADIDVRETVSVKSDELAAVPSADPAQHPLGVGPDASGGGTRPPAVTGWRHRMAGGIAAGGIVVADVAAGHHRPSW